jgi:hypothetical protein
MIMILGEVALSLIYVAALLAILSALVYLVALVVREQGSMVGAGGRQTRVSMTMRQSLEEK